MKIHKFELRRDQHPAYDVASRYLTGRLEKRETLDWALKLGTDQFDEIKRAALLDYIHESFDQLNEPWKSAWRLIEKSWNSSLDSQINWYCAQNKIDCGDRSGQLTAEIVSAVAPRISLRQSSYEEKKTTKLYDIHQLFYVMLTCNALIPLSEINLRSISETEFLVSTARELEEAVARGIDAIRHCSSYTKTLWEEEFVRRVCYPHNHPNYSHSNDPDELKQGLVPSVRLLGEFVSRLVDVDEEKATEIIEKWLLNTSSTIFLRLWATFARNSQVVPADKVVDELLSLDDRSFWNFDKFPEIAELRAIRFREFAPAQQERIVNRIRNLPPCNLWTFSADTREIKQYQEFLAAQELRRVQVAGGVFPPEDTEWLNDMICNSSQLAEVKSFHVEITNVGTGEIVRTDPDNRFDFLVGKERLFELNSSLSSTFEWPNPADEWFNFNTSKVLADFETLDNAGDDFPRVWDRFGSGHSANKTDTTDKNRNECLRVLSMMNLLSYETLNQAIAGISDWFYEWRVILSSLSGSVALWMKIWPIAVKKTNSAPNSNTYIDNTDAKKNIDFTFSIQALNSPVGKLTTFFLSACPSLSSNQEIILDQEFRRMRSHLLNVTGRSKLIVIFQLIQHLPYFYRLDQDWANQNLIDPLKIFTDDTSIFWRALSFQIQSRQIIKVIGSEMLDCAVNTKFDRKIRESLVTSLVFETLQALYKQRKLVIEDYKVQQMIRMLDDEVRIKAAYAVQTFCKEISEPDVQNYNVPSNLVLFQTIKSFFSNVWPQEHSLLRPGVSEAFAIIPSIMGEHFFADTVKLIKPNLAPFPCYSMHCYGFSESEAFNEIVNNELNATALLSLMDSTIGNSDESMVPYKLSETLSRISVISRKLRRKRNFLRLETLARN